MTRGTIGKLTDTANDIVNSAAPIVNKSVSAVFNTMSDGADLGKKLTKDVMSGGRRRRRTRRRRMHHRGRHGTRRRHRR